MAAWLEEERCLDSVEARESAHLDPIDKYGVLYPEALESGTSHLETTDESGERIESAPENGEACIESSVFVKDTGWSWVICGALSSMYLLLLGYIHVFGLLFVALQAEFHSTASATASILAVYAFASGIMSLFACNFLVRKLSARQITLAGGVIAAGGVAMGTFAESLEFLMFTNGIMLGIGSSLIFGPAIVIVERYFDRRRSLAMAIVMAGSSVGGIVLPPFTRFLLDEYGVRGTILIFGGVLLHVVPAAMLLIPPKRITINGSGLQKQEKTSVDKSTILDMDIDKTLLQNDSYMFKLEKKRLSRLSYSLCNLPITEVTKYKEESKITNITPIYKSLPAALNEDDTKGSSQDECKDYTDKNNFISSIGAINWKLNLREKLRSAIDPSLFKTPLFYLFISFHVFGSGGIMVFTSFFPPTAKENGLSDVQITLLVSLFAGLDLFCRILTGIIADLGWFKRYRMLATAFIILGTVYQFVGFHTSFPLMVFYIVMFGIFSGFFYSLHPSIAVDFFGREKFSTVYGYTQFTHGVVRIASYPIVGALRDMTGDYVLSCHFLGAGLCAAALILFAKPLVVNKPCRS